MNLIPVPFIALGLVALAPFVASSESAPPPTTVAAAVPTTVAAATTTVPSGPTTTIPIPAGYVPLVDDSHTIVIAVPAAWVDVNTSAYFPADEGSVPSVGQPSIAASPNIQSFYTSFDVPGVSYFAVPFVADPLSLLGAYGLTAGCKVLEVKEYDDPYFLGYVQVGTDCGPNHMTWNMVVANPVGSQAFTAVMQVQTADPTELETVLRTFNIAS